MPFFCCSSRRTCLPLPQRGGLLRQVRALSYQHVLDRRHVSQVVLRHAPPRAALRKERSQRGPIPGGRTRHRAVGGRGVSRGGRRRHRQGRAAAAFPGIVTSSGFLRREGPLQERDGNGSGARPRCDVGGDRRRSSTTAEDRERKRVDAAKARARQEQCQHRLRHLRSLSVHRIRISVSSFRWAAGGGASTHFSHTQKGQVCEKWT